MPRCQTLQQQLLTPTVVNSLCSFAAAVGVVFPGVVLRVDSPGGDALASDLMWREIRKLAEKKPVVACMGDVAASGGYYMGMAAQVGAKCVCRVFQSCLECVNVQLRVLWTCDCDQLCTCLKL